MTLKREVDRLRFERFVHWAEVFVCFLILRFFNDIGGDRNFPTFSQFR
jgi:hypothetical protein